MISRPTILSFLVTLWILGGTVAGFSQVPNAINLPMPIIDQSFQPSTNTLTASWSSVPNSMGYYVWLIDWNNTKTTNTYVISPLQTNLVVSNIDATGYWLGYIGSVNTNGIISPLVNCIWPALGILNYQLPADTNILWSTDMVNWKPMTSAINYSFTNLLGQTVGAPPKMFFKPHTVITRSSITSLP